MSFPPSPWAVMSRASWGPQASCQTKGVWHCACTGPIACDSYYGTEKPPSWSWGFSAPPSGPLEEGEVKGEAFFTSVDESANRATFSGTQNLRKPASVMHFARLEGEIYPLDREKRLIANGALTAVE